MCSDSLQPHGLYSPWNSPGQNTGMGSLSFLQGIFPTQGLNPGLLNCRWILYQPSHKGSPQYSTLLVGTDLRPIALGAQLIGVVWMSFLPRVYLLLKEWVKVERL